MIKRVSYIALLVCFLSLQLAARNGSTANLTFVFITGWQPGDTTELTKEDSIFNQLELGKKGLGRRAYDYAMLGYVLKAKGKLKNDRIITIADMSTPSGKKRLFVIDLVQPKLIYVTYVAHGRESGLAKTLYFSN